MQNTKRPLYRGMHTAGGSDKLLSKGSRLSLGDDELHMSGDYVSMFDNWTKQRFGTPFLSKGVFTTGSKDTASKYGEVFLVIPVGQFDYIWSPTVHDNMVLADHIEDNDMTHQQVIEFLEQQQYTNQNLNDAVQSGNEIILSCVEYFHISEQMLHHWNSDYTSLEELWIDLRG